MIQIKGAVNFPISLDSTTWIFDDRKVTIDDLERGVFDGTRPINFDDNKEWNRAILEGQTNPPTLDSEIKYKKRSVLDETFVINMTPFFKNAEPMENASTIKLSNKDYSINVPMDLLPICSFNFLVMANVYIVIMLLIVSYIFLKKDTLINLSMSHI